MIVWAAVGTAAGAVEGLLVARGHGYYFNATGPLFSFLYLPAIAYAVAGVLIGALVFLAALPFVRSTSRALEWSTSLCLPFFIFLFWGSALDGRFFGTIGNALGHIGMVGVALVSLVVGRRMRVRVAVRSAATVGAAVLVVAGLLAWLTVPHGSPDGTRPSGSPDGVRPHGSPDGTRPHGSPDGTRSSGSALSAEADAGRPNILLVTIDTLRWDRTVCGRGIRPGDDAGEADAGAPGAPLTPNLDAVGAAGVVFENAVVPEVVTDPSHASLLTALPPWEHGVVRNAMPLRTDVPVMAERMADAGYATAAFVSVEHLDGHISHLSRGFGRYADCGWEDRYRHHVGGRVLARHAGGLFAHERNAREVVGEATPWITQKADAGEAFFAWVHIFDPHMPYTNHETGRTFTLADRDALVGRGAEAEEAYDSEVRFADRALGVLLDAVEQAGVRERTIVCVTSDHGEHMAEDHVGPEDWFGHVDVFDEVCRVPLVMAGPGLDAGRRISDQVSTMDVAPALLAAAGVARPLGTGVSALQPVPRPLVTLANPHRGLDHRSVRDGRWKLMERGGLPVMLFDLAGDPNEMVNVIQDSPEVLSRLAPVLAETPRPEGFGASGDAGEPMDSALREMLEALGYVE